MSPVALDAELVAKLTANGGQVTLTDAAGKPVGYFLSPAVYEEMRKALYDAAFAEMSEEDVADALADPRRHGMDEVLKLLGGN